jgi:adenylate cyclase class 2
VLSNNSKLEIEIKLRVPSASTARRMLQAAGFRILRRRAFEDNVVFDTPDLTLRGSGRLLRVRCAGSAATLTYKGPAAPGKHKSREEIEIGISDAPEAALIFGRLGYRGVFRYQKFRTEYARSRERGIVTLDETPIGCFLEIEGTPRWIDRTARRLGFSEADYITASYGGLYFEQRKEQRDLPPDMVFPRRST